MAIGQSLAKRARSGGTLSRFAPVLVAIALLLKPSTSRADDWITGTGGHATHDGLSAEHGPTANQILWDQCPHISEYGGFAPVIGAGLVVSSRPDQNPDIPHGSWIVAQDLDTGSEVWSVQLPINFPDSWGSRVLAIRDGHIYATRAGNSNSEYVYALGPADGSILWQSEDLIDSYGTEAPSFTADGDLIVGNFASILRIRATDGTTAWQVPRQCLSSGGCEASVFGDRAYSLTGVPIDGFFHLVVNVYDVATGALLYGSSDLRREETFGINQIGVFVGADGTVYAPLANNTPGDALVSLTDTGSALTENWRVPMAYVPFATFATGPDNSVYSFSTEDEVIRIDPASGNVLNTSLPIPWDGGAFTPHLAIDARGRVFLSNGAGYVGALYALDPDLKGRWQDSILYAGTGGPAIGARGTLVVEGFGTTVRAYRTPFSGDVPLRVDAHTNSSTSSNGNGVLEAGETVLVEPSWENGTDADASLFSTASNLNGPGDGAYAVDDPAAEYGTIPAGGSATCFDATETCPRMTVGIPSARPATHWDAVFLETSSVGAVHFWTLHVGGSFDDVPSSSLYYPFVETIFHNGITAGCGGAAYCPNASVKRAPMAVFLLRSRHGQNFVSPPATGSVFDDVPAGSFAADWIEELAAEGVTGGCSQSPSLYCPDAPVTRAQMAVFLLKMEHGKRFVPAPCSGLFADVSCPDGFAADWIETLAAEGVTAGCGNADYCPDAPSTRGQMAAFLARAFGLRLYGP